MADPTIDLSVRRITSKVSRSSTFIELLFILEGNVDIHLVRSDTYTQSDHSPYSLHNSDIILFNPTEKYVLQPKDSCTVFSVLLPPQVLSKAYKNNVPVFVCNSAEDTNHDYSVLRNVLSEIMFENLNKENDNQLMIDSLLYRMLYILKAHHSLNAKDIFGSDEFKSTSFRIQSIRQYILQNYRSPITLQSLSTFFYLTPQYLSRFIKIHFHITFYKYLTNIRLESATVDLSRTDETLTDMAYNNGFPNLSAFNKAFKDKYGVTPTEYRAQQKQTIAVPEALPALESEPEEIDYGYLRNSLNTLPALLNPSLFDAEQLAITANAMESTPYVKTWENLINIGYTVDFNDRNYYEQIKTLNSEIHFTHMRIQGIFGVEQSQGKYSFASCDKIFDFLSSIGIKPYIEISNKHKMITTSMRNTLDINNQTNGDLEIVPAFKQLLKHVINRYGPAEVEKWKFGFWAEHNHVLVYDQQSVEKYVADFREIYFYSKNLLPGVQIGGPGFNAPADISSLTAIMKGLTRKDLTPDFLSFYIYPYTILSNRDAPKHTHDNTHVIQWDKAGISLKIAEIKQTVSEINPMINKYYISEWNSDHINRNPLHDSLFKAPYIIYNVINNFDHIESLAYSPLSDISCEYKDTDNLLFGGSGLLTRNGIKKPGYYAYYFLSKLGTNIIKKSENYIITTKYKSQYEVLIINYKHLNKRYRIKSDVSYNLNQQVDYLEDLKSLNFTLDIDNVSPGKYIIKQYVLSSAYGSILNEWARLNMPDYFNQSEIDYLERTCIPKLNIYTQECNQTIRLQNMLEPNEVNLYIIRKEYS
jgi:beta-xylosidase/AraC-like DNA-binding protein